MKKKILFALISSMFIFTASGCKRYIRLKNEEPTIENVDKIGKYIKNMDLSFNDVTFKSLMDEAINDIKGATSYDEVNDRTIKVFNKVQELIKKYYIADALYYYDPDNEYYEQTRDALYDVYIEYEAFRANLIYELKDNFEILQEIFQGYTDEEINYEIELSKKKKDEKYKTLKKEIEDIETEFNKLEVSLSNKSNNSQILEILYRYVNKNKELSSYLGFDSYTYYKDIDHKIIYTDSDREKLFSLTKEYILPLMDKMDAKKKVSSLSYPEFAYLSEFESTSAFDKDYNTINLAKDYAKDMGGTYYKTFNNFLNSGHYIFASGEGSLETAYTDPYLSYFGPNYQDIGTVIHEFGHYYSMNYGYADYKSLDLQEFYSQANEFLFLSYLEQNCQSNLKKVYDTEVYLRLSTACKTLMIGSAYREFEDKIYSTTLTAPSDIYDIWNNLNKNEYDNKLDDYWKFEIRYNLYYLSYATSVTGAISLYSYSRTNFTDAKLKYISACNNTNMDDDIEEILKKNNLSTPFEEETFIEMKKLIEEKG